MRETFKDSVPMARIKQLRQAIAQYFAYQGMLWKILLPAFATNTSTVPLKLWISS